jgi:adhesin transport system outer membrane protein
VKEFKFLGFLMKRVLHAVVASALILPLSTSLLQAGTSDLAQVGDEITRLAQESDQILVLDDSLPLETTTQEENTTVIAPIVAKLSKPVVDEKIITPSAPIKPSIKKTKKRKIHKEKPLKSTLKKSKEPIKTKKGMLLKDAILLALKHSYKISSAREKVIQAKRKVDEKLAAYKPTVNLYNNAGGAYLSPYKADEVKFLKSDESIVVNQNIYAGGKHSNEIKRERANLLAAQEKFKDKVEEETVKIIDAYLSLIYQKMGIEITRANMLSLQKILDIVTTKEESGAASKGDLNYIKSQVENASSALVKSESKYQNAIAFYEYYVGKLDESTMPVEYTFTFELEDKETILKQMQTHNSKLQVARAKMDAQKHNLRAQKAKFHPTLDLSITAKDKQSGYEAEPQEDRVTGLLSLNYNLYNGGKDKAILLGTKSKISELQYKLIDLEEGSEYNTKQLYENILSSMDSLKHTENEVEANRKVIDSYWAAFKYGTQDIQALLLAQRALNRSELDVIKEKQAYTNGYFKLMQQTGMLLEKLGLQDFTDAKKIIQDKSLNYFY